MQMTMQTLPVLPTAGDPLPPAPRGDGSKTAADTFAVLLGRTMETPAAAGEGNPTPWASPTSGSPAAAGEFPVAPAFPAEKGTGVSGGEKEGSPRDGRPAKVSAQPAPLHPLFKGEEVVSQEEVSEPTEAGVLPEAIAVAGADEGTDFRHPAAGVPSMEVPEISSAPPVTDVLTDPAAIPPQQMPAAGSLPREVPGAAILPVHGAVSTDPAQSPAPAGIVGEAPLESEGLIERQFGTLIGKTQDAPLRGNSRAVPEFRPAPHSAAATAAPASPQAAPAAVEAVAKGSPAPAAEGLLPPVSGAEEGAPPVQTHPSVHVHPAGAEPSFLSRENPQATAPAVHLPSGQIVPESRIVDQVVGRLAVGAEGESGAMTLKLNPKELGEVTVDLVVEKDRVKAQIIAQNQQVQEVLERHLPKLRTALENQGLRLDTLQVSVDSQGGGGRGFFQEHQRPSAPVRFAWRGEGEPAPGSVPVGHSAPRQGSGINLRV